MPFLSFTRSELGFDVPRPESVELFFINDARLLSRPKFLDLKYVRFTKLTFVTYYSKLPGNI